MYLLREELKCSYPFIGQKLGGRDHTTAIHDCEKISEEVKINSSLSDELNLILEKIYNKL
jgi:chromosomal replication initiator protein